MRRFLLGLVAGLLFGYGLRRTKSQKYNQDRLELYYQRRAKSYQATDQWVQIFGYAPRVVLRQKLVEHANLKAGDRVLDIGCGAGGNFPYIMEKIGETGELVGVDYSEAMLAEAQKLIDANGWKNVFLVREDAGKLDMGETYDVVLSALAMIVIPEWEAAMERAFAHVREGGMFAIADLCESQRWYMMPANLLIDVMDATLIVDSTRRPWETMHSWVEDYRYEDFALGYMYAASGRKPHED